MFTGIVEDIGFISKIFDKRAESKDNPSSGIRIFVEVDKIKIDSISLGESIAIQGACMTVSDLCSYGFYADVSEESLNCTVGISSVGKVNLERSLIVGSRLGGHILYGHIDCIGKVFSFYPIGDSKELIVEIPSPFARFIAYKGSIAINGVSLTINSINDFENFTRFSINIIPHTQICTSLQYLNKNDFVNIEIDGISRYIDRILDYKK